MGLQFDRISYSSDSSLTLLIDDFMRQSRDEAVAAFDDDDLDMQDWFNALLRQSNPLIHTKAGRANLEAWLDQVEQLADV